MPTLTVRPPRLVPHLIFVLPFVVFPVLTTLQSGYNILVMNRIREEAKAQPIATAVRRTVGSIGTTVTTAGLVLGGSFAAFGMDGASR